MEPYSADKIKRKKRRIEFNPSISGLNIPYNILKINEELRRNQSIENKQVKFSERSAEFQRIMREEFDQK